MVETDITKAGPGPSSCEKNPDQVAEKLQEVEQQQHQLLLLTKEFVQRNKTEDPVRHSFSKYVESVIMKLPNDLYRRVSRQIQGVLDEALDEVDRRDAQPTLSASQQHFGAPMYQHPQYQLYQPHHQHLIALQPPQWQPPSDQLPVQPLNSIPGWKPQQADCARSQDPGKASTVLHTIQSAPAPVASPAPDASTPTRDKTPNMSNFLRRFSEDCEEEMNVEDE